MTQRREWIAERLEQPRFSLAFMFAASLIAANEVSAVVSLVLAA